MLLVIDVGNTNIVLGVYDKAELVGHWRISTDRVRTTDEYGMLMMNLFFHDRKVDVKDIKDIIISSVVPPMMPTLERVCLRYFNVNPLIVGPGTKTGIAIKYDNPREVGADRIVNAVAAHEKYKGDLIIIDFGTATTYCAVQGNGDYMGGVITPGVTISAEALFQRAAKLPRIEVRDPGQVICRNTVSSMQSGMFYGYVGQVEGLVSRMKAEMGNHVTVVATGGLAQLISSATDCIDHVETMLSTILLRTMNQARYSINNIGHFALATKYYTHFTSPIRRYPDLLVHRMIRTYLFNGDVSDQTIDNFITRLPNLAESSSEYEKRAVDCEREVDRMKKCEYMLKYQEQTFRGIVSSVTNFGVFITLERSNIEGLVHIKAMNDDYYTYDQKNMLLIGRRKKKVYRLGDEVIVKVANVDLENQEIDFKILKHKSLISKK